MQVEVLDRNYALDKVSKSYPYIMIEDPGDAIALIVPCLEEGDLPLLCSVDDVIYNIGSISNSALVINKLLRVSRLTYYRTEVECIRIRTSTDIMQIYEV